MWLILTPAGNYTPATPGGPGAVSSGSGEASVKRARLGEALEELSALEVQLQSAIQHETRNLEEYARKSVTVRDLISLTETRGIIPFNPTHK